MPADLHCHTKISDGSTVLEDVITLAKNKKLSAISITDHDTLAGVTRARVLGERFGVKVIPGAEFSCYDYKRNRKVHLLAYMFTYPDRLEGLCRRTGEARKKASLQMISKIRRYYPITTEMVVRAATGGTNIFKQHIMHTLMHAGYATEVFGELYDKLLGAEHGSCFIEAEYPDVFDVMELLKSAGSIIVLAHPTVYDSMELLDELIPAGLDGVEVWHPRNNPTDIEILNRKAAEHNLIRTGGSDFHGMYSARPVRIGECTTPDDCLAEILARKDKKAKGKL